MRRAVFALVLAVLAAACSAPTPPSPSPTTMAPSTTVAPSPPGAGCRAGDPKANVYHPSRLTVLAPCQTASGTVETVRQESDGDVHFDVALDAQYANLLNAVNQSQQHGYLVVEIVPADAPGCVPGQPPKPASGTYDYGICTGADIPTPVLGARVQVVGPWVSDGVHGWNEIHPVWQITMLAPASRGFRAPQFIPPNDEQ